MWECNRYVWVFIADWWIWLWDDVFNKMYNFPAVLIWWKNEKIHTHTLVCKNSGEASIQIIPINKNSKKRLPSLTNKQDCSLVPSFAHYFCVDTGVCVCVRVFMLVYKCCKTLTINLSFRKQVINSVSFNNITVLLADNSIEETTCLRLTCLCQYLIKSHLRIFYGNQKTKSWHGACPTDGAAEWHSVSLSDWLADCTSKERANTTDSLIDWYADLTDRLTGRWHRADWQMSPQSVGGPSKWLGNWC